MLVLTEFQQSCTFPWSNHGKQRGVVMKLDKVLCCVFGLDRAQNAKFFYS